MFFRNLQLNWLRTSAAVGHLLGGPQPTTLAKMVGTATESQHGYGGNDVSEARNRADRFIAGNPASPDDRRQSEHANVDAEVGYPVIG
jgi:hypothetical protein